MATICRYRKAGDLVAWQESDQYLKDSHQHELQLTGSDHYENAQHPAGHRNYEKSWKHEMSAH